MRDYNDFKKELLRMSGIEQRLVGDAVQDFALIDTLKKALTSKGRSAKAYLARETARWGLVYLMLFHKSGLVRHEAAFTDGTYSKRPSSFLDLPAIFDSDPVVRHEACLAMATPANADVPKYGYLLGYIATHDGASMVRDSARVAINQREERTKKPAIETDRVTLETILKTYRILAKSALSDTSPLVRHEACMGIGIADPIIASGYRLVLEYIQKNDETKMVRKSASIALELRVAA